MIVEHWRDGELYERVNLIPNMIQASKTVIITLPVGLIELATYDELRFNKKALLCLLNMNEP